MLFFLVVRRESNDVTPPSSSMHDSDIDSFSESEYSEKFQDISEVSVGILELSEQLENCELTFLFISQKEKHIFCHHSSSFIHLK